jgi:hypothetical protein
MVARRAEWPGLLTAVREDVARRVEMGIAGGWLRDVGDRLAVAEDATVLRVPDSLFLVEFAWRRLAPLRFATLKNLCPRAGACQASGHRWCFSFFKGVSANGPRGSSSDGFCCVDE